MTSLAARILAALAAATIPALAVAGIVAATLIVVVSNVETDFNIATSTARRIGEVRLLIEKEHGLVARLPAELDLAKVDNYVREIAATDWEIDQLIERLASNERAVSSELIAQIRAARIEIRKATADIAQAARSFAQSTAVELVNGAFETNTGVAVAMLDAIASNVDAIAAAARAELRNSAYWVLRLTPIAFIAAILAAGFSLWMVRRQVVAPLNAIGSGMRRLAANDMAVSTSGWPRAGELGQMTHAVEHFKENAVARARLESERNASFEAAEARSRRIAELATAFETKANVVIASLGSASDALTASANAMTRAAAESENRAQDVASSTGQASAAVKAVAAASEEISIAIRSIAERIVAAQSVAGDATNGAQNARATMSGVVQHCKSIGTVIDLIDRIASETNLLALNATIEAARAGDSGRGFGVVATEVKTLASQTAKATDQVTQQIHALQAASGEGSQAVEQVSATISRMDEIARAIGDVMHQQTEAVREISESAHSAATGTAHVLQSISGVTEASKRTRGISNEVGHAASKLAAEAEELAQTVRAFLSGLEAA